MSWGRRPNLHSSASTPVITNHLREPAAPLLPALTPKRRQPRVAARNAVAGTGTVSKWPARVQRGDNRPPALVEIEEFLSYELSVLDAPADSSDAARLRDERLQAHREGLDLFIAHFSTYAAPLSAIKAEYDGYIEQARQVFRNIVRTME